MKTKTSFLAIVCAVLFFSCNEDGKLATGNNATLVQETTVAELTGHILKNMAFSLRVSNAGFYVLQGRDDGTEKTQMVFHSYMNLGEEIITGEFRRLTFATDGVVYNCLPARRQTGPQGFVIANSVGVGETLGVVVDEEAFLFLQPKMVNVTGIVLSRASIAVLAGEETDGFVEIKARDAVSNTYVNPEASTYIRSSTISKRTADVESVILWQTALTLTQESHANRRRAMLEAALVEYPDSVFYQDIYETLNPSQVLEEIVAYAGEDVSEESGD
jgi:hypothetical protein